MPTEAGASEGRLRVAFVVYNDVHGDTRVLKIAKTLEAAGAEVRVFAANSEAGRYPDGLDRSLNGLDIYRLPTLALQRAARRVRRAPSKPSVVTSTPGRGATTSLPTTPEAPRPAPAIRLRLERSLAAMYAVTMQWLFWRRIEGRIVDWAPDIIHAHDANTLPACTRAARKTRARLVYDSHELWTDRNVVRPRPFRDWLDQRIERSGIGASDAVITVSPSIAEYLREKYLLDELPALVRNVPPYMGEVEPIGRLRELAGLEKDACVIAYCGSITTNRGIEATISSLAHLEEATHLVLLGEGQSSYVASLSNLAERLSVGDRVHFVGRVASADVPATLSDADVSVVFTVPVCRSYLWSLPNKLFESIHAGIPIVASDLPDVAALVKKTGVGLTAPIDDEKLLAAAIGSVIADSAKYRENARAAARTLNWQTESKQLLATYRRLAPALTAELN